MRPLQMPATPPTSGGIVLRPFRAADVGMLRDLATDPYVPLIGSLPPNASEQEALDFIERQHNRLETGVGYSFGWTLSDLFRIELYVEPWNVGSVRTAEAVGYLREGLLRSHQPIGGRQADMLLYASLRPGGAPTADQQQ
jgi:[ribosomal protein S5]-alanine N-acetyltransferase